MGTDKSYSFNRMVEMINEMLGMNVGSVCVENPFEVYVHDTEVDYSKVHDATE